MSEIIHSTIDVRVLGTGRRMYALEKTRPLVEAAGLPRVVARIDDALEEEKRTWPMELAWRKSKGLSEARGNAVAIDVELDRTFSAFHGALEAPIRGLPGSQRAMDATMLRDEVFPQGLRAVQQQPFEESRLYLREMSERFRGDLAELLKATGTTDYAERIIELSAAFEAELERTETPSISFPELRAARDRGNLRLKQIVIAILAETLELDAESEKKRARLLGHIRDQERRAAEARKRRKTEVDIDPATGEELDDTPAREPVEG